jgi:hypothetical protein
MNNFAGPFVRFFLKFRMVDTRWKKCIMFSAFYTCAPGLARMAQTSEKSTETTQLELEWVRANRMYDNCEKCGIELTEVCTIANKECTDCDEMYKGDYEHIYSPLEIANDPIFSRWHPEYKHLRVRSCEKI